MLQQTAEQTNSYYAQFLFAKAYYDGKLTAKNDKQAFEWAKKSYEVQGTKNNFYKVVSPLLGILYAEGKGVAKDHDMALEILHIMMDTKQETKRK